MSPLYLCLFSSPRRKASSIKIVGELKKLAEALSINSWVSVDNERRGMGLFVTYPNERQLK